MSSTTGSASASGAVHMEVVPAWRGRRARLMEASSDEEDNKNSRASARKRKAAAAAVTSRPVRKAVDRQSKQWQWSMVSDAMVNQSNPLRLWLLEQSKDAIRMIEQQATNAGKKMAEAKAKAAANPNDEKLAGRVSYLVDVCATASTRIKAEKRRHDALINRASLSDEVARYANEMDIEDRRAATIAEDARVLKKLKIKAAKGADSSAETESDSDEEDRKVMVEAAARKAAEEEGSKDKKSKEEKQEAEEKKKKKAEKVSSDDNPNYRSAFDTAIDDAQNDMKFARHAYRYADDAVSAMFAAVVNAAIQIFNRAGDGELPIPDVNIPPRLGAMVQSITPDGKFGAELTLAQIRKWQKTNRIIRALILSIVEGPTPLMKNGRVAADDVEMPQIGIRAALKLNQSINQIFSNASDLACFGDKESLLYAERITQIRLIVCKSLPRLLGNVGYWGVLDIVLSYTEPERESQIRLLASSAFPSKLVRSPGCVRAVGQSNYLDIILMYESPFFEPVSEGLADGLSISRIYDSERSDARHHRAQRRAIIAEAKNQAEEEDDDEFDSDAVFGKTDDPVLYLHNYAVQRREDDFKKYVAAPLKDSLGPQVVGDVTEGYLNRVGGPAMAWLAEQQRLRKCLWGLASEYQTLEEQVCARVEACGLANRSFVPMVDTDDSKAEGNVFVRRAEALAAFDRMSKRVEQAETREAGFTESDVSALSLAIPRQCLDLLKRFIKNPPVLRLPVPSAPVNIDVALYTVNPMILKAAKDELKQLGDHDVVDMDEDDTPTYAKWGDEQQDEVMAHTRSLQDARRASQVPSFLMSDR